MRCVALTRNSLVVGDFGQPSPLPRPIELKRMQIQSSEGIFFSDGQPVHAQPLEPIPDEEVYEANRGTPLTKVIFSLNSPFGFRISIVGTVS